MMNPGMRPLGLLILVSQAALSDDVSELGDAPGEVDAEEWSVSSSSL